MTALHLGMAVRAVILDDDDRLLLCRFSAPHPAVPDGAEGVWSAPGGGVELAEEMQRHVWSYQLNEDRTWAALEDDAPPHDRAPDEEYPTGTILHVPRSDADEAEYDRLRDLEGRIVDLEYDEDPRPYGEALLASAAASGDRWVRMDSPRPWARPGNCPRPAPSRIPLRPWQHALPIPPETPRVLRDQARRAPVASVDGSPADSRRHPQRQGPARRGASVDAPDDRPARSQLIADARPRRCPTAR